MLVAQGAAQVGLFVHRSDSSYSPVGISCKLVVKVSCLYIALVRSQSSSCHPSTSVWVACVVFVLTMVLVSICVETVIMNGSDTKLSGVTMIAV